MCETYFLLNSQNFTIFTFESNLKNNNKIEQIIINYKY